jgi:hypothetical protein
VSAWLNLYGMLVFVGIGGLQMYRVNAGFLTNYGADLFAPPYLYFAFRLGRLRMRPRVALLTIFGGCALWEWSQRYDWAGTPLVIARGTFDPLDLAAYAVGLLACYLADLLWLRPRGVLPS